MICIKCKGQLKINETRNIEGNYVVRRRKCLSCGNIMYTKEFIVPYENIRDEFLQAEKLSKLKVKN